MHADEEEHVASLQELSGSELLVSHEETIAPAIGNIVSLGGGIVSPRGLRGRIVSLRGLI